MIFSLKDSVIPIVGRDVMRKHDVHHRTAKDKIYVGETEIPGYTMKGAKVKGSVSVILPGKVRGSVPDGVTALLTPAKTVFQRTGLLVCDIAVKTKEREVPLRVLNAGEEPCVIHKGTRMGILAPIDSSKNWQREEHLTPDCSDCSCHCVCSEEVRAVVHQFVVYNDCKPENAKPQVRAGCCHQLQVVSHVHTCGSLNKGLVLEI